ncbi:YolD-like family protein [Gorillibacterium sp. sgz5001074]|uniref:YolD-like family protein n=1 Tax=Gorillibacterium sp. sgz5001074 TaxID=3446695 RepID=UPI003F676767
MIPQQITHYKPSLTPQHKHELIRTIAVAMFSSIEVHITLYSTDGDITFTGTFTQLDKAFRRLKIDTIDGGLWVNFDDLLNVQVIYCY